MTKGRECDLDTSILSWTFLTQVARSLFSLTTLNIT
jgi:hypothetical protein